MDVDVGKDVRVTPDEFVGDTGRHVVDSERRCRIFLCDTSMKDDLQQQVPELFAQSEFVAAFDSIDCLVRFFE